MYDKHYNLQLSGDERLCVRQNALEDIQSTLHQPTGNCITIFFVASSILISQRPSEHWLRGPGQFKQNICITTVSFSVFSCKDFKALKALAK